MAWKRSGVQSPKLRCARHFSVLRIGELWYGRSPRMSWWSSSPGVLSSSSTGADQQDVRTTLRRTPSAWQKECYAALPPMSPTIAPNPILYVVEQASTAAFTCSESPPNAANNTVKISAKTVSAATVEKISLNRGVKSASL
jgi:hypothetical protein